MATTKKQKVALLETPIDGLHEAFLACLRDKGTRYLGPVVLQAPGAWTREGPAWVVPGVGWVIYGPGLAEWGTTQGLAQLAHDTACKPRLHAVGWAVCPAPNLAFAVEVAAMAAAWRDDVRDATQWAAQWEANGRP